MTIIGRLIGLPFAVIDGTIDIAHEGIGIAVDKAARKRRQRKEQDRQSREYPSCGRCPNCANREGAISSNPQRYDRESHDGSSELSAESSARSQGDNCGAHPYHSPPRPGPHTELPIREPNFHSSELPANESPLPELDSNGPTLKSVGLPYSDGARPGGMYVFEICFLGSVVADACTAELRYPMTGEKCIMTR